MSERLSEEAEKYIEDFISSIEDTDISSIDGDRSDTSSSIGGIMKARTAPSPATPLPLPVEMDGISFPWLKWETSTDATPTPTLCISNTKPPSTPKTMLFDSADAVIKYNYYCYYYLGKLQNNNLYFIIVQKNPLIF